MTDCFEIIEKAAINWARSSETKIYQTLLQGLVFQDTEMAVAFLKFVNQMIYRADNDEKKANFIARFETQGIFKLLQRWGNHGNDEIDNQITAFELHCT